MNDCYVPVYEYNLYVRKVNAMKDFRWEHMNFYKNSYIATESDGKKLYLQGWSKDYGFINIDEPEEIKVDDDEEAFTITMFSLNPNDDEHFKEMCIREIIYKTKLMLIKENNND